MSQDTFLLDLIFLILYLPIERKMKRFIIPLAFSILFHIFFLMIPFWNFGELFFTPRNPPASFLSLELSPSEVISPFSLGKPKKSLPHKILSQSSGLGQGETLQSNLFLKEYELQIRDQVRGFLTIPLFLRKDSLTANPRFLFHIRSDGTLVNLKLSKESGYHSIDQFILQAIKRAAPFPPLPQGLKKEELLLELPFTIRII